MNYALKSARGRRKPVSWERGSKLLALIMRRLERITETQPIEAGQKR